MVAAGRRSPARGGRVLLAAAAIALVGVAAGLAGGYRVLVVRSGSMAPALQAGDAIVVRAVAPAAARPGQVVTFRDPSRAGLLVTHRVRELRERDGRVEVVTRGDANREVERWSIGADGRLGRLVLRLPRAGRLLGWLATPWLISGLLLGGSLVAAAAALRRIWNPS
jgi:signal peptidase I